MPKMKQEAKIAPPSAPMLNADPNEPEDVLDPPVPPGLADEVVDADFPGLVLRAEPGERSERVPFDNSPAMPPAAPRMPQAAPAGTAPVVVPSTVPALPDAFLPLAHGFCQYLQAQVGATLHDTAIRMTKDVDLVMSEMAQFTKGVLSCNEHAEYQLSEAIRTLKSQN